MALMTVAADDTTFRFGTQSLKCTTGSTGDNAIYPSTAIPVTPGESRAFSIYIKTLAPITGGSLYLRVAQAGLLTPVLAQSDPVTDSSLLADVVDGFGRIPLVFTVPTGVFSIRPFLQYSGTTADQVFWLDGVKLETGVTPSEWQQNLVSDKVVHDPMGSIIDASQGGIFRLRGSTGGTRDTVSLGTQGLLFGGDAQLLSDAASEVRTAASTMFKVGGSDLIITGDARIKRNTTKELTFDDNAGGDLTRLRLGGGLLRYGGTAFPASPASTDLFFRTDIGEWFKHDGTQWRCTINHEVMAPGGMRNAQPIAATSAANHIINVPDLQGGSDIWLVEMDANFMVNTGGTALDGSNKWVGTLNKGQDGSATETTVATFTINSGASGAWRSIQTTIGALLNAGTTHRIFLGSWTKTGTPGTLYSSIGIVYNHVAT